MKKCLLFIHRLKQRNDNHLKHLIAEKESLRREIYQRVKNNLQITMSLLDIQSRNHVYALSLIHQRLAQTGYLEAIEMNRYIPELVDYLHESFAGERNIQFDLRIQPIRLDVAQAVPVGLILSEAITNSITHAFPDQSAGHITIVLEQQATDTRIRLEIADDGVGVPPGFDIRRKSSMGMQLIDTLVQQLAGDIAFSSQQGLTITIRFASHYTPVKKN